MSDSDLRALERRARATGHVEDQAALLRARVRSGELAQELLELAAYVGDPRARAALGPGHAFAMWLLTDPERGGRSYKTAEHVDTTSLLTWGRTLARWGREVDTRAALAAAGLGLDASGDHDGCEGAHTSGLDCFTADAILRSVQAWLDDPSEANLAAIRGAYAELTSGWYAALWAAPAHAAFDSTNGPHCEHAVGMAAQIAGEPAVRDAIRSALTSWALGEPTREGAST